MKWMTLLKSGLQMIRKAAVPRPRNALKGKWHVQSFLLFTKAIGMQASTMINLRTTYTPPGAASKTCNEGFAGV